MDFGSLALLREEAKKKRLERQRGRGEDGKKPEDEGGPETKRTRKEEGRSTELLKELQEVREQNAVAREQVKENEEREHRVEKEEEEVVTEEARREDCAVMVRLRKLGEPICFFGETARERAARLQKLEAQVKEKMPEEGLRVHTSIEKAEELRNRREKEKESGTGPKEKELSEDGSRKKKAVDKTCKEEVVRKYLKGLLKEWEAEFAAKSTKEFLESHRGKMAAVTLKQCRETVSYLFDLLRERTVPKDVVDHLDKIVSFMKQREYMLATDEYLKLSIGNAPWPMGVTMVGIHERAGRERIFSDKVARLLHAFLSQSPS